MSQISDSIFPVQAPEVEAMMPLASLPPDPEPTPAQLERYMPEWRGAPKNLQKIGAQISWTLEWQRQNPNAFLVPFVPPELDYPAYRRSPLWASIRAKVLADAEHRCCGCNANATQVHHRDYRPRVLSGDDLTPLVPICVNCHDKIEAARKEISWQAGERILAKMVARNDALAETARASCNRDNKTRTPMKTVTVDLHDLKAAISLLRV